MYASKCRCPIKLNKYEGMKQTRETNLNWKLQTEDRHSVIPAPFPSHKKYVSLTPSTAWLYGRQNAVTEGHRFSVSARWTLQRQNGSRYSVYILYRHQSLESCRCWRSTSCLTGGVGDDGSGLQLCVGRANHFIITKNERTIITTQII